MTSPNDLQQFNRSDFRGQDLRFRQGGRLYSRRDDMYFRMDGTDERGRLMLLSEWEYRNLQRRRNEGYGDGEPQYYYL